MRDITLEKPKRVTIQEAKEAIAVKVFISYVTDNGNSVIAEIGFGYTAEDEIPSNLRIITLWEGDDYEKIGQWTDSDVISRVLKLI